MEMNDITRRQIEHFLKQRQELMESPVFKQLQEMVNIHSKNAKVIIERLKPSIEMVIEMQKSQRDRKLLYMPLSRSIDTDSIMEELQSLREELSGKKQKPRESYILPKNASWSDLTIKFSDGQVVKVKYKGMLQKTFDFKDMGFLDAKTQKQDKKWEFLEALAKKNGRIMSPNFNKKHDRNLKYEVNKRLKKFFGMKTNPIPGYTKKDGYYTLFKLSDR